MLSLKTYKKLLDNRLLTINGFMKITGIDTEAELIELLVYGYGQLILRDIEEASEQTMDR